ncbi:MAG: RNA polymerase sigma factor [Desulfobacula sp.]|nr:RNA polymerase sigma factor [Desulfobacula sp.]
MYAINYSQVSNEDLYEMCIQGNDTAWHYLYNYVLKIIRSKGWRLRDDPEDMAQNIICHLLSGAIDKVNKKKSFRSFVKTVAVHKVLDSFKKKQVSTFSYDAEDAFTEQIFFEDGANMPGAEEKIISNSTEKIIHNALKTLSDKCKIVLSRYIEYKMGIIENYKALAKIFGETIGTISSRINRCLEKLKNQADIKKILDQM